MKLADFITPLNQKHLQPIIDNPALLAILPIIYGAWADAELTESELECIIPKTRNSAWLTETEQDYIIS